MATNLDDGELERFSSDLLQDVLTEASIDDQEAMLAEAFAAYVLDMLNEWGEWPERQVCYHRQRGAEVSGWGWDEETGTLDLAVVVFEGVGGITSLTKRVAEAALNRLQGFLELSVRGLHESLEEASPQFDLAYFIFSNRRSISRARLFLLTDSVTTARSGAESEAEGIPCRFEVWDLERLQRVMSSGGKREEIDIDFVERFGRPLPCLPALSSTSDLDAYLLVIPGEMLAELYNDYGPRLLELNVRSYLQARGKVNKGIRDTIINEPDRFFAYNNGISATASSVHVKHAPDGTAELQSVSDLQIVNGGQTTASIATAARKDKAPVWDVFVQAKLTVVDRDRIEEIVPLISRFANTQNRVSEADLSANHPFHVAVEELSRTIWAPAAVGGTRETRWFYERARGQYQDALGRESTPARKRKFKEVHPPKQKFAKTDLAKFENTWAQRPHIVSRGAQKSFVEFMQHLVDKRKGFIPDDAYFRQLAAKGLMFRAAERIVARQEFGGYRANIVAYSLSLISNATAMTVDLDRIWRQQALGPGLESTIESVSRMVYEFIVDPPGGQNVTEWCKKEKCWKDLQEEIAVTVSGPLSDECTSAQQSAFSAKDGLGVDQTTESEQELIDWVPTVPAATWFGIATWAKQTGQLQPWQRGISASMGKYVSQGHPLSKKQAKQAKILYEEAQQLGFDAARMDP